MSNRISTFLEDPPQARKDGNQEPQPIGEILAELFTQYEGRFPGVRIAVVETQANAI